MADEVDRVGAGEVDDERRLVPEGEHERVGVGEVGVAAADLPGIAAQAMGDYMMANLPAPLDQAAVESLLHEAL